MISYYIGSWSNNFTYAVLQMTTLFLNLLVLLLGFAGIYAQQEFTYNGFRSANLILDGIAEVTNNGLLILTNDTLDDTGHAFYPHPVNFKKSSNGEAFSFSTTFVFAIRSELKTKSAQGLAFVIAPTKVLPGGRTLGFLGLFNQSTNANAANHVFAVELDTYQNTNSNDLNGCHVGIDINQINSLEQKPAGYNDANGSPVELSCVGGNPIQVWVKYDGVKKQISVTLAPLKSYKKPSIPLLHFIHDLSPVLQETMYVGFSASTSVFQVNHYIMGWSFSVNGGIAQQLDASQFPGLPRLGTEKAAYFLIIGLPLIFLSMLAAILGGTYYVRIKGKFSEVLEDWEVDYGPHRFKYEDLYTATKGFRDTELLGAGGFGRVYRGILQPSGHQIAVKRVSHESRQGLREFVAEIVSIGRMSHRNLVPLLGYCRRKDELLLVYEYMSNGSLDKFLYGHERSLLNWDQRFQIIKGVATGLFYLHDEWEQVVVHRDVKASNVLLDAEMNGRLGDFGLARLYDHGTAPKTTHVAGTVGYLAPEQCIHGRATTNTDVYSFGVFLLEVVCGRRPIEPQGPSEEEILVNRVYTLWNDGRILEAIDQNLGTNVIKNEAEMVLKLGLLCCNPEPTARPSMQKVMLYLDGSTLLPELSSVGISPGAEAFAFGRRSSGNVSSSTHSHQSSAVASSVLTSGR